MISNEPTKSHTAPATVIGLIGIAVPLNRSLIWEGSADDEEIIRQSISPETGLASPATRSLSPVLRAHGNVRYSSLSDVVVRATDMPLAGTLVDF